MVGEDGLKVQNLKFITHICSQETAITIPMKEGQRSVNLSNSVAIVAYEIIRQIGI